MENTMTLREKLFGSGKGYVKRNAGILIGLLVICIVISISSNKFLTQENLMNVLRQISTNLYLASGMTMILICGGIDLSVGSIIAITGVTAGTLLNMGLPIPLVILGCLMMGALYGTINGTIISRTTLPPFIVTYSMMQILRGATYVYTGGTTVRIDNRAWINLGTGYAFDFLPLPVIYLLVLLVIVFLIPLALKGVKYRAAPAAALLRRNLLIYGIGGVVVPFIGIKLIDVLIATLGVA